MAGEIVLVLEDDLTQLNMMSKQLSAAGYSVTPVVEGRLALADCRTRRPDLVVCDLSMPGMDGFEFIRQLRQEKCDMPVVVVTGQGQEKAEEALAVGANAFLLKPVARDRLLSTVEKEIAAARERARGTRKHILVFEEEPTTQRLMHKMLEPAGFRVTSVENGAAALEIVASDPPDLVVCDIVVPGIDGIQLITRLRREQGYKAPILVVSGHAEEQNRQATLGAGASAFMAKPVERPKLLARVKELLSESR
jgi:CheY-like chemotaxis protein